MTTPSIQPGSVADALANTEGPTPLAITVEERQDRERQRRITELRDAAEAYQRRGWPVVPMYYAVPGVYFTPEGRRQTILCSCGDPKCQCPADHPVEPHSVVAISTPVCIPDRDWLNEPFNVGIRCGQASGLIVIDVQSLPFLTGLERLIGRLPATVSIRTPDGWMQLLYRRPTVEIGFRFVIGLNIRSDCQYVVAPPSCDCRGREYRFFAERSPDVIGLADLPAAWLHVAQTGELPPDHPQAGNRLYNLLMNDEREKMGFTSPRTAPLQGAAATPNQSSPGEKPHAGVYEELIAVDTAARRRREDAELIDLSKIFPGRRDH